MEYGRNMRSDLDRPTEDESRGERYRFLPSESHRNQAQKELLDTINGIQQPSLAYSPSESAHQPEGHQPTEHRLWENELEGKGVNLDGNKLEGANLAENKPGGNKPKEEDKLEGRKLVGDKTEGTNVDGNGYIKSTENTIEQDDRMKSGNQVQESNQPSNKSEQVMSQRKRPLEDDPLEVAGPATHKRSRNRMPAKKQKKLEKSEKKNSKSQKAQLPPEPETEEPEITWKDLPPKLQFHLSKDYLDTHNPRDIKVFYRLQIKHHARKLIANLKGNSYQLNDFSTFKDGSCKHKGFIFTGSPDAIRLVKSKKASWRQFSITDLGRVLAALISGELRPEAYRDNVFEHDREKMDPELKAGMKLQNNQYYSNLSVLMKKFNEEAEAKARTTGSKAIEIQLGELEGVRREVEKVLMIGMI